MNADWAKGRNERTGLEGIFPRSYVTIVEEKSAYPEPPRPTTSNYGNLPLDVSQSGGSSGAPGGKESKFNQQGKKFGKKLGNASQSPRYFSMLMDLLMFCSDFWRRGYHRFEYCQRDSLEQEIWWCFRIVSTE